MKKILSILSLIIISMLLFTSAVNANTESFVDKVVITNFNMVGTPISELTSEEINEILDKLEKFESKYNALAVNFPGFIYTDREYNVTVNSSVVNNGIYIQKVENTYEKLQEIQKKLLKYEEEIDKLEKEATEAKDAVEALKKKIGTGEEPTKEEYIEALETYVEKVNLYYAKVKEREEYYDKEAGLYDDTKWIKTTNGEFKSEEANFILYVKVDSKDENGEQKNIYARALYSQKREH